MTTPQGNGSVMDFPKFISSLTAIFKSVPQDKLADLNDLVDHAGAASVPDLFNGDENKIPSRAQIGTGPAVSMRGGGVDAQIARGSDFAAQAGMTELYNRFEGMLADFGKSVTAALKSQNEKVSALAGVVSDVAKAHAAIDEAIKSAATAAQQTAVQAPSEDSFFGKAQSKLVKAQKAFRKAEMEEDEDCREERKSKLTDIAEALKSVLKLVRKADDEEAVEDDDVEKAVHAVKSLQGRVNSALATIKAEEDKEKEDEAAKALAAKKAEEDKEKEEEAAKAAATAAAATAAAAAKKAEGGDEGTERTTQEERKDDTAKAQQQIKELLEKSLNGQATLDATMKGVMEMVSGMSRVQSPPTIQPAMKGAPLAALQTTVESGLSSLDVREATEATALMQRHHMAAAGHYPSDRLQADVAGASPNVRRLFAVA